MAGWLFKEEPDCYSFADLERDGSTVWSGVNNNLARQNLRKVSKGDRVLFYATGKVKAVIGEMEVTGGARKDPKDEDPKSVVVTVRPVRRLQSEVSLARIRKESQLADWDLVKNSRLSVMSVSSDQWQRIVQMSQGLEAPKLNRRTGPPKSPRPARKNKD